MNQRWNIPSVALTRPPAGRVGASFDRRYGNYAPRIGAAIWQTPGGVVSELSRINDDFNAFGTDIREFVTAHGYPLHMDPKAQPIADLYMRAWLPLWASWQSFYKENKGWTDNFWWNHAPEGEQLLDQLNDVRAKARTLGMVVLSADPSKFSKSVLLDPGHNLVDDAAEAAKKATADLFLIVKIALIAALGLAGVVLVIAASRRSGGRWGRS